MIVERLRAMQGEPGLSARAARRCTRLIERFETPVRVVVFGLPGAGKAAVVNALAGAVMLQPGSQSAPVLIRHGARPAATLTRSDGQTVQTAPDIPFVPPTDAAIVELVAPAEALAGMSLLNVVADPSPEDMGAALTWAAARCDIAIWCTRHWTQEEQAIWSAGPEGLKDHALMLALAPAAANVNECPTRANHAWCDLRLDAGGAALCPASQDRLRRRVAGMIEEARGADLDAAVFLLEQYAPQPAKAGDAPATPQTRPALNVVPVAPRPKDTPPPAPEAHATLSRLILDLRGTARDATARLDVEGPEGLLETLGDAFSQMLALAEEEPAFGETWPALLDTLRAAEAMVLLFGFEGGDGQTTEAAILLAQVRDEMEGALAA
ncbi:hypothetical protein [Aestuariicoccus sp. MJ-SS9]|uniref:hypothetical protein n=1 Tax=Aestuariicoccus sp. MJ-SS9 TaxID=3079855 RepID=UPI002930B931|nr:hypothetical protein [Aestuariicoccus sp. MJ-SS9]